MVGLLLIAHTPLASALAAAAQHVYARSPDRVAQLSALDVQPDSDMQANVAQARRLAGEVDSGNGVLVLTDALGASPGNVAAQLAEPGRVAVVAGVNLPMLLRALCYRDGALADAADKALAGGVQGVAPVAPAAGQPQGGPDDALA